MVPGGAVSCAAPALEAPNYFAIALSLDGGVAYGPEYPVPFSVVDPAVPSEVRAVEPLATDMASPAQLTLATSNVAPLPSLRCLFGELGASPATFAALGHVLCTSPPSDAPLTVPIRLEASGRQGSTGEALVTLYDSHRPANVSLLSSSFGPLAGAANFVVVHGTNFAPTSKLRCRFAEGADAPTSDQAGRTKPSGYAVAHFVSVNEVLCDAPPRLSPATVRLAVTTDGASYGLGRPYTYYDPTRAPTISSVDPVFTPYATPTTVTLSGVNFAPTGQALRVRWGRVGETAATFVSGTLLLATSPPSANRSLTVHLQASLDGGRAYSSAAPDDATRFTYYDSRAPPRVVEVTPVSTACFSGGVRSLDAISGKHVDVSALHTLTLSGSNFAPTSALACVFHGVPGSRGREMRLPAAGFVSASSILCPLPAVSSARASASAPLIVTRPSVWMSATNDGRTYRASWASYEYAGGCEIPEYSRANYAILALLGPAIVLLGALSIIACCRANAALRALRRKVAWQRSWMDSVIEQAAVSTVCRSSHEYRLAFGSYLRSVGARIGEEQRHYFDFLRHASYNRLYDEQPPAGSNAPSAPDSPTAPASPSAVAGGPAALLARGVLSVHVESARVEGVDADRQSDPFVVARFGSQEKKTRVEWGTCTPRWDERLSFTGTLGEFTAEPLRLDIIDRDPLDPQKDVPLGIARVALQALRSQSRIVFEQTPLDGGAGDVTFSATWIPTADTHPPMTR